jgi:hypothetical protein
MVILSICAATLACLDFLGADFADLIRDQHQQSPITDCLNRARRKGDRIG